MIRRNSALDDHHILPTMTEWEVFPRVAVATARAAQTLGITRLQIDDDELYQRAYRGPHPADAARAR